MGDHSWAHERRDTTPRPERVAVLAKLPLVDLVRRLTMRRNTLARMEEHGMPHVIIDEQRRMVAEVEAALRGRGHGQP